MLDELDFRKEAKNIADFTEFLERAAITDAVAPRVCFCVVLSCYRVIVSSCHRVLVLSCCRVVVLIVLADRT